MTTPPLPPPEGETPETRPCTCHSDDDPPVPCPRKFAYHECMKAALADVQRRLREAEALFRKATGYTIADYKQMQQEVRDETHATRSR